MSEHEDAPDRASSMFRAEALDHHRRGRGGAGSPLQLSPSWTRWTYALLLVVAVGVLAFVVFGQLNEYAGGPAVVLVDGLQEVSAMSAGTVRRIAVAAGDEVTRGQPLVWLDATTERAELDGLEREFNLQLVRRLRDPSDTVTEAALVTLNAARRRARDRLDARVVRSPVDATVSDVRTEVGQHLLPGQAAVTLAIGAPSSSVLALMPGSYGPRLAAGMELVLKLHGYARSSETLRVESVSRDVIGPAEARRLLGSSIGDAVNVSGPVVVVRATATNASFESDGRRYPYRDGMMGSAEVRLRSRSILGSLLFGEGSR